MQFQDTALQGILIMDLLRKKRMRHAQASRFFPETQQLTSALSDSKKF
jgi:hypothetical protein